MEELKRRGIYDKYMKNQENLKWFLIQVENKKLEVKENFWGKFFDLKEILVEDYELIFMIIRQKKYLINLV